MGEVGVEVNVGVQVVARTPLDQIDSKDRTRERQAEDRAVEAIVHTKNLIPPRSAYHSHGKVEEEQNDAEDDDADSDHYQDRTHGLQVR